MKKKNYSDYIIAGAVVGCSLILLLALTAALVGLDTFQDKKRTVLIDFPSVTGIQENAEVRYAGKPAGQVVGFEFLTPEQRAASTRPDNAVRVKAIIYDMKPPVPPIKRNALATITSDTLLAEKYINIMPAQDDGGVPELGEDEILAAIPAANLDDLTREGQLAIQQVNKILAGLDNSGAMAEKFSKILDNAESLTANADELLSALEKVINQNEGNVDQTLKDLYVSLQNLKVVSTYAKSLVGTLAEKPNRIIWGGVINKLPAEKDILKENKPVEIEIGKASK
jgi:ABC-type transporter Mla subunit MlaD